MREEVRRGEERGIRRKEEDDDHKHTLHVTITLSPNHCIHQSSRSL